MSKLHFGTLAVHAGVAPDPTTGAIMTPIYQTSTYVQAGPGEHKGYEYARTQNPTRDALQAALGALEGGLASCFASGMAATDAVLKLLRPGDEVIASNDLYGGTYRIMQRVFAHYGIRFHFVDLTQPQEAERVRTPNTRMLWIETPTNPLLNVVDIATLAHWAQQHGIRTAVDNTFATPCLQQPLALGADMVVHSVTKYLGGHSDTVMGAVVVKDEELHRELRFIQNAVGAVPGPQDCFLVLRGLKTLHLRMERHCANARRVADHLAQHPRVAQVFYPGHAQHKGHATATSQMKDYGGMVSFVLKDDSLAAAIRVMKATQLFALAESLGGVESLIGHPASMTHASIPAEQRHAAGMADSLIRLSVGIEHVEDLLADLDQALDA